MSWKDLKDYNECVIESNHGEVIAFFEDMDDAELFCKAKQKESGDVDSHYVGHYIDTTVNIQVMGS